MDRSHNLASLVRLFDDSNKENLSESELREQHQERERFCRENIARDEQDQRLSPDVEPATARGGEDLEQQHGTLPMAAHAQHALRRSIQRPAGILADHDVSMEQPTLRAPEQPSTIQKMRPRPLQRSVYMVDLHASLDGANDCADQSSSASNNSTSNDNTSRGGVTNITSNTERSSVDIITPRNAQALCPPSALAFVANLNATPPDMALEVALNLAFSKFGRCWVKVFRNVKGIPYAFIQYQIDTACTPTMTPLTIFVQHPEQCLDAIEQGNGTIILGRACRTEKGRVQRWLFVFRRDRFPVGPSDVDHILEKLSRFGRIEEWTVPSAAQCAFNSAALGFFVKFELFQPCQDAHQALRNDAAYEYNMPRNTIQKTIPLSPSTPQLALSTVAVQYAAAPKRYYAKRISGDPAAAVYVGNLPHSTTKQELENIFTLYGEIRKSVVNVKSNGRFTDAFAYIYYERQIDAIDCVCTPYDAPVHKGHVLHVDWKISPERKRPHYHADRYHY